MLAPDEHGSERPVVMDFGLARDASRAPDLHSTDGPMMAGTLAYMAPEQLEGKTIGPTTDIYALGIVMFEMLTGELPFKGEPALASAWKRVSEPAPGVGAMAPEVAPWVQRLVAACLERDPARRPSSVQDIERMLRGPEAVEPVASAPHALPPAPFARRARMAVAGATLLGGAATGVWFVAHSTHSGVASGAERTAAPVAPSGQSAAAEARAPSTVVPPTPAVVPPKPRVEPLTRVAIEQPPAPVKSLDPKRKRSARPAPAPKSRSAGGVASPAPVAEPAPAPAPVAPGSSDDPDERFIIPHSDGK
jgi:serine/threonine-protein kinase